MTEVMSHLMIIDDARLKLLDGLHPTAAGIEKLVNRILPKVEALIELSQRKNHQFLHEQCVRHATERGRRAR